MGTVLFRLLRAETASRQNDSERLEREAREAGEIGSIRGTNAPDFEAEGNSQQTGEKARERVHRPASVVVTGG